jgi:glucose/arabinose dehydrogenase
MGAVHLRRPGIPFAPPAANGGTGGRGGDFIMRAFPSIGFLAAIVIVGSTGFVSLAQSILQGTAAVELKLVTTVGGGASTPDFGTQSGDPRFLYIGQQTGEIRILDFNQSNPLLGTDFLNVGSVLGTSFTSIAGGERGLLGGAFHPNFNSSDPSSPGYRKFYTYTSETISSGTPDFFHESETGFTYDHQSVIREWTANAPNAQGVITINAGIPSRVLMRIAQPAPNHNGGGLVFGPDNYLYIALGDGGGGNDNSGGENNNFDGHTNQNNPDGTGGIGFYGHGNAQDRRNLYGKILRIKPTTENDANGSPPTTLSSNLAYRIPNDNPFTPASNPSGNQIPGWQASWADEIYAFGLRNPFSIGFDSATGKFYAGDVGQYSREEVDAIVKGGNYGWVAREGTIQTPDYPLSSYPTYVAATGAPFIDPIASYFNGQASGGSAVIGGYVYHGGHNPALEGKYVFGDLYRPASGADAGGRLMYMDLNDPGPNQVYDLAITGSFGKPTAGLHGIARDASGELYYLFDNGQIIKLLPKMIPGDYNRDGVVNNSDFQVWRSAYGQAGASLAADGNGNGIIDASDYIIWRKYNGTSVLGSGAGDGLAGVPEACSALYVTQLFAVGAAFLRWRRSTAVE